MRVSRSRIVSGIAGLYVQIIQGIPLPVLMFLSYFGGQAGTSGKEDQPVGSSPKED